MSPFADDLTIDHVDPQGDNDEKNLVTACWRCNSRKKDKHARVFMGERFLELQKELLGVDLRAYIGPDWMPPFLEQKIGRLTLTEIEGEVYQKTEIKVTDRESQTNSPRFVAARRMFAIQAKQAGYSLNQIGKYIRRHHTTVLHLISNASVEKFNSKLFKNKE